MKIAHISDLHLLSSERIPPQRLLGKRFSGWVNIRFRRGAIHKRQIAQTVARALRAREIDHVVITGDVTNLSLESEFELVRSYLEGDLGMPPDQVSMVPGNHDVYTRGAHRDRRFQCYFGEYVTSDLPGAAGVPGLDRFPYVRLRGEVAIIGLSTAVPRAPMVASGQLGKAQCMALHALLAHREVEKRFPVILQHHPWHPYPTRRKQLMQGLEDAAQEAEALRDLERGLVLHGHLHRRVHRQLVTARGILDVVGATSASLLDEDETRMGGFNVYEVDASGLRGITSERLDPATERFLPVDVPRETVAAAVAFAAG
ncbi:MAG: metallophosphoesterase [Polyangiaceae bacterium]